MVDVEATSEVWMRGLGLVLLAACRGDGSDGGDTAGQADEPGGASTTSELVWVDADGVEVPDAAYVDGELGYFDADGIVWTLDPYGEGTDAFGVFAEVDTVYADAGCNERWAVEGPAGGLPGPRQAMYLFGVGAEYAAGDGSLVESLDPSYDGDCERQRGEVRGLPVSSMTRLTRPTTTWTPPLHPETR